MAGRGLNSDRTRKLFAAPSICLRSFARSCAIRSQLLSFLFFPAHRHVSRKSSSMSDEEFDPCECMWNDLSIQHLLSIIRRSQDYCSDIECFRVPESPGSTRLCSDFIFTCIIIVIVAFMYVFRPTLNFRQSSDDVIVKNNNEPGPQNGPPSPPTAN